MPLPRSAPAAGRSRWRRLEWALPFALTAGPLLVGVRATHSVHSPGAMLVLALLYGALALVLFFAARFAMRAGRGWGAAAALGLALAPAFQLRIEAGLLQRPLVLGAFVLLVAAGAYGLLALGAPRERRVVPGLLAQAYGALAVLIGATLVAVRTSDELRWHFFENHRLFGAPLYWLDARPLLAEREALWSRHGPQADPRDHPEQRSEPPVLFQKPPHIVFLLVDTLRADALAALGGAADVMPTVNALAERSVVFTNVHANASWTRASCASIFTGLLPEEHGAARFHERLSEDWVTLPETLRAAGYQTAAFVANWVQVGADTGFAQGFDAPDFHELMSGDEILARAGAGGEHAVREAYARAEAVNRSVLEWCAGEARDPYKPLFLYVHYLDPHTPYLEPPEPGTLSDPEERRRGLYRQQLRYFDRQLARFLADLEQVLAGPKLIVLTSDHGEEFYEHDELGHGHALYKELLWVPLLVHRPDGRAARVDAPLELRDLYTLVPDLAREPELDPLAWGAAHARVTRYASQYLDRAEDARPDRKWTGLRRVDAGGASLIWSAYGSTWQLYDERTDPGELRNRIDEDERAELLRAALEDSVRFWTAPLRVERTARELDFLRALGYAGGVDGP